MFKFWILPVLALALAWAFGRNPSARLGFQVLAVCWGIAVATAILILATMPDQVTNPMFFIQLLLLRIPYLLMVAGPFLAVAAALLASRRTPEGEERQKATFEAAKTAAAASGKVAGGLAGSFIKKAAEEFKKS